MAAVADDVVGLATLVSDVVHAWVVLPIAAALELTQTVAALGSVPLFRSVLQPSPGEKVPDLLASCVNSCPRHNIQERLCALLACVPKNRLISDVITVDLVRAIMILGWSRVYLVLHGRACRDVIYAVSSAMAEGHTDAQLETARATLEATTGLELMDVGTPRKIALRLLRHAPGHLQRPAISALYDLFGPSILHRNSRFERLLLEILQKFPKDAAVFAGSCASHQCHYYLTYARADLSPRTGSEWLRELCLSDARDEEERHLNLSVSDALRCRLNYFSRAKRDSTKAGVILYRHCGQNLFQFALRIRATYSVLGRILSDFLAYIVAEEMPTLLAPAAYMASFREALSYGFYNVYHSSIRSLGDRADALFRNFTPKKEGAFEHATETMRVLQQSGLHRDVICAKLSGHDLKARDIISWRRLLRICLSL